jgi:antimicrobial peptide system SdpB family protein
MILQKLNKWAENIAEPNPFTNVYGLARSILATGTLLTLLCNSTTNLFFADGLVRMSNKNSLLDIGLFTIFSEHLEIAKIIAIFVLLLVISGYRPRITGILHWYITFSFYADCSNIDGGDHLANVLSFLLIPICLSDNRVWHWQNNTTVLQTEKQKIANLIAWLAGFVIRLQVCIVYFQAGVAKIPEEEWKNGTAFYYWFIHTYHGADTWLKNLFLPILQTSWGVTSITWGTIIFEILLFLAIVMKKDDKRRHYLLISGLLFHFSIVLVHGLVSFFFSIAAGLILYLRPLDKSFNFKIFK